MQKEIYYLVRYKEDLAIEGVFTLKSFKNYLKKNNDKRKKEEELTENEGEFIFQEINLYL